MIEPIMYFGIGFLVAALLGLLFVPLVHNRAVRLTMRRLEAATPLSIAEIRADKDQLRAEFAMSTRRLEMSVEQMKTKTTAQLAELGKKSDAINQLKKELGEKTAAIFAFDTRDKTLRDQMRATEEEFELKSSSLREAERALADKEAELAKLVAELGERSMLADTQRVELAALHTQVEALKVGVTESERAVKETEERLARERAEAETRGKELTQARDKLDELGARTSELERQLVTQTTEAEILNRRVQELETRLGANSRSTACRPTWKRRGSPKPICAANFPRPAPAAATPPSASAPISSRWKRSSRLRPRIATGCRRKSPPSSARRRRPGRPSGWRTRCCASASTTSPPKWRA